MPQCSFYEHIQYTFYEHSLSNTYFLPGYLIKYYENFLVTSLIPVPMLQLYPDTMYFELQYIGTATNQLPQEVISLINRFYPHIDPRVYFRNDFSTGKFFKKHRNTDMLMRSSVVYKYTCDCCQQSYISSTELQLFCRCAQHKGVSFRTGVFN